jgi:hypothetical protein
MEGDRTGSRCGTTHEGKLCLCAIPSCACGDALLIACALFPDCGTDHCKYGSPGTLRPQSFGAKPPPCVPVILARCERIGGFSVETFDVGQRNCGCVHCLAARFSSAAISLQPLSCLVPIALYSVWCVVWLDPHDTPPPRCLPPSKYALKNGRMTLKS